MATTIYIFTDAQSGDDFAFPSLSVARSERSQMFDRGWRPEIRKIVLAQMPKRELLCALYNRSGFASEQSTALPEA